MSTKSYIKLIEARLKKAKKADAKQAKIELARIKMLIDACVAENK